MSAYIRLSRRKLERIKLGFFFLQSRGETCVQYKVRKRGN